jgi:methylaspartate ammonia-lyase
MRIKRAFPVRAMGGYYNEDLEAIRRGALKDGFFYVGESISPEFAEIKMPSEAVSIVLVLDDDQTVFGDALSVEFAAAGGRKGRFTYETQIPYLKALCEKLEGVEIRGFFEMCEALYDDRAPAEYRHPAVDYGVSQALLQAVAVARGRTAAEALADELGVQVAGTVVPIQVQTGEERRTNVDKAILKKADVLPHGLINDVARTFGSEGQLLAEYVAWVAGRIRVYGSQDYRPELHFDVYGLPGLVFECDISRIADYLVELEGLAAPHDLAIESPIEMESRAAQIEIFGALRAALKKRGSRVNVVVDEWANTLEDIDEFVKAGAADMINVKTPDLGGVGNSAKAVLRCWKGGVRPILGGSSTDTDQSARVIAQVALACRPAWVLARPGMGVDEGVQIMRNEMCRTLALIEKG